MWLGLWQGRAGSWQGAAACDHHHAPAMSSRICMHSTDCVRRCQELSDMPCASGKFLSVQEEGATI